MAAHKYRWITALCLVGLVASTHAGTHTIEGRIVGVSDGDTITLLDVDNRQHKIRLDGIDAPERGQQFGEPPQRSWPTYSSSLSSDTDVASSSIADALLSRSGLTPRQFS